MAFFLFMKQANPRNIIQANLGCGECLMPLEAVTLPAAEIEAKAVIATQDDKFVLSVAQIVEAKTDLSSSLVTDRLARQLAAKTAQYEKLKVELGK